MVKILVIADMGVHSGFGTVTSNIFDRLATKHGMDIHTLAVNWRGEKSMKHKEGWGSHTMPRPTQPRLT